MPTDERLAAALRGFGPSGLAAIVVILAANVFVAPLGAVLALVWARQSSTPWAEIGYARPPSWLATIAIGVVFGIVFKLVMKAVVMPLLGAPPVNQAYYFVSGNVAALVGMMLIVTINGGFGEETLFRGYLFERLGKLFGSSVWATIAIVLMTTALFASLHYHDQGAPGVEQAVFTGLVFGTIFAITRRIWLVMVAHAVFDLTALALIYWNLEEAVAHFVFAQP